MILSLFCMEVSPLGSKHRCVLTFEQHPGLSACVDGGKKGLNRGANCFELPLDRDFTQQPGDPCGGPHQLEKA